MADSVEYAIRAATWAGVNLDHSQLDRLSVYRRWLADEAVKAGGIGPSESPRLWQRHIGDSLLFLVGVASDDRCADLGSGAGLPGLPLSIALPDASITLVERSRRKCDLLRRAVRILGLSNCTVIEQDLTTIDLEVDSIVSRAALPPAAIVRAVTPLAVAGVPAIIGYSHEDSPPPPPPGNQSIRVELVSVPTEVLDTAAHLLRIGPN